MSILNLEVTALLVDIGYLVKLLSNHWAILIPKIIENFSNIEGWALTIIAYKK